MGSAAAAAWIAYIAFAVLVVYGLASGELRLRGLSLAVLVCVGARAMLAYLSFDDMFFSVVAMVDVALVLVVFKGDVRL